MSRLTKLMAKPEEFTIGGEVFSFKPLTVENLDLILMLEDPSIAAKAKALRKVIDLTLKEAVPDATDEEIKNIPLNILKGLNQAIMKVNGIAVEGQDSEAPEQE